MKKIEFYINVLSFCFYRFDYNLHLLMKKINLASLLFKIPLLKERFKELGVDPYKYIDKTYGDKRYGLSATRASGVLTFILIVFFMTLITFFLGRTAFSKPNYIACAILSVVVSYFFSFRNDKYLKYYRQFEKWPKSYKRKYGWYTFTFIVILFYSCYLSTKVSERGILCYLIKHLTSLQKSCCL
jgi:hypothetical protein